VEAASSSETSTIYKSPQRHITENLSLSQQHCDNSKCRKKKRAFIINTDVTDGNPEHSSKFPTFPTVTEITKVV